MDFDVVEPPDWASLFEVDAEPPLAIDARGDEAIPRAEDGSSEA
ncbi:MAG: hypothetical protein ACOZNI_22020 [Myxococcota bacterium]